MDILINWIKNIAIFMILSSVVMNLLGNSQYRKYAGLITGMILVVIIAEPLLKLFDLNDSFQLKLERYSLLSDVPDMSGRFLEAEESRNQAVMAEYRVYLQQQVEELVSPYDLILQSIHFEVVEDIKAEKYGSILSIKASFITGLIEESKESSANPVQIDKVRIDAVDFSESKKDLLDEGSSIPSPFEIKIKNLLADFYNLKLDNIIINIWEEQDGG